MTKTQKIERDLFSNDETFDEINENEIAFPIFVKNNSSTCYTWYKNETQFEQITINAQNESFRGSIIFGFNEQLHDLKYDLKIWLFTLLRVHTQIEQHEYDEIFAKLIRGREEFFDDSIETKYIERELTTRQKNIKHKWKSAEY